MYNILAMKATDLKIPFTFEERRPIILDRLLYVPSHYDKHDQFDQKISFPKEQKINVEYCSGNGEWIIDKAKKNPDINWIGVEKRFDRARKIWVKLHNNNISNLFVVLGEAEVFTKFYLQDKVISDIFINFPDPWPKRRHDKHRLFQDFFVLELRRVLLDAGQSTFVTDDPDTSDRMYQVMIKNGFKSLYENPHFTEELQGFGSSYFDRLWRDMGRRIRYLQFVKN
ncbi:MAG: tRNA (guanosine(46)-N7)-methyltransferase TrmB [Chlamydiae bacterium]|nr:tRNA (guanosine(46)-N7)-methyltransferase TrmB [Chlamydiota bacterium]